MPADNRGITILIGMIFAALSWRPNKEDFYGKRDYHRRF